MTPTSETEPKQLGSFLLNPPWWKRRPRCFTRIRLARHIIRSTRNFMPDLTPAEARLLWRTLLLGGNIHINTKGLPRVSVTANGERFHKYAAVIAADCVFVDCDWKDPNS